MSSFKPFKYPQNNENKGKANKIKLLISYEKDTPWIVFMFFNFIFLNS